MLVVILAPPTDMALKGFFLQRGSNPSPPVGSGYDPPPTSTKTHVTTTQTCSLMALSVSMAPTGMVSKLCWRLGSIVRGTRWPLTQLSTCWLSGQIYAPPLYFQVFLFNFQPLRIKTSQKSVHCWALGGCNDQLISEGDPTVIKILCFSYSLTNDPDEPTQGKWKHESSVFRWKTRFPLMGKHFQYSKSVC